MSAHPPSRLIGVRKVIVCGGATTTLLAGMFLSLRGFCQHVGEETRSTRIHQDFQSIRAAITMFKDVSGRLPTGEEGISALVRRPSSLNPSAPWQQICSASPLDPWGRAYGYVHGTAYPDEFGIYCLGPNGLLDLGDGRSDDTFSWPDQPGFVETYGKLDWKFHFGVGLLAGAFVGLSPWLKVKTQRLVSP